MSHNIRQQIVAHIEKTGRCPNYETVGGYDAAKPVFDEMLADGTLVGEIQVSPKGRKISVIRLAKKDTQ